MRSIWHSKTGRLSCWISNNGDDVDRGNINERIGPIFGFAVHWILNQPWNIIFGSQKLRHIKREALLYTGKTSSSHIHSLLFESAYAYRWMRKIWKCWNWFRLFIISCHVHYENISISNGYFYLSNEGTNNKFQINHWWRTNKIRSKSVHRTLVEMSVAFSVCVYVRSARFGWLYSSH